MTTMLEKITNAIGGVPIGYDEDDEFVSVPIDARLSIARAALLAMREPSKDILDAASDKDHGCGCPCCWANASFSTVIDAILAQPSTTADVTPA